MEKQRPLSRKWKMIQQVFDRIHIADMEGCRVQDTTGKARTKIHACKSPCHQQAVGYTGSLRDDHPHYLHFTVHDQYLGENALYLNIIDPHIPLFKQESFEIFLKYMQAAYDDGQDIVIHCNQGRSRAPTLVLLFAAKRLEQITDESFDAARAEFEEIYEDYAPGKGIETWMQRNWGRVK